MKRVAIAALVMLVAGAYALPVFAQGSTPGAALGTISISSSSTAYRPAIVVPAFAPTDFWVLIELDFADIGRGDLNAGTGILAWEGEITIPVEFAVLSAVIRDVSVNVGSSTNVIAGLANPILAINTMTDLVQYQVGFFGGPDAPVDVELTLQASTPSSFNPAVAGFNDSAPIGECTKISDGSAVNCLRPFALVRNGWINPSDVATDHPTWGTLKGNFGD